MKVVSRVMHKRFAEPRVKEVDQPQNPELLAVMKMVLENYEPKN